MEVSSLAHSMRYNRAVESFQTAVRNCLHCGKQMTLRSQRDATQKKFCDRRHAALYRYHANPDRYKKGLAIGRLPGHPRKTKPIPTLICQCGCDEIIPPRPGHRNKPVKYIPSHYLKMGSILRVEKMRQAQALRRLPPPSDWVVPSGICECGCGKKTNLATRHRPELDEYTGFPKKFVPGHWHRLLRGEQTNGWRTGKRHMNGYLAVYLPGHPQ